jgi:hypothetical protein
MTNYVSALEKVINTCNLMKSMSATKSTGGFKYYSALLTLYDDLTANNASFDTIGDLQYVPAGTSVATTLIDSSVIKIDPTVIQSVITTVSASEASLVAAVNGQQVSAQETCDFFIKAKQILLSRL